MDQLIEFNSLLNKSGITFGWLALIAVLFTITFVLSTRELLLWYFKSHHLHAQIEEIKESLARIERRVNEQSFNATSMAKLDIDTKVLTVQPETLQATQDPTEPRPFTLTH